VRWAGLSRSLRLPVVIVNVQPVRFRVILIVLQRLSKQSDQPKPSHGVPRRLPKFAPSCDNVCARARSFERFSGVCYTLVLASEVVRLGAVLLFFEALPVALTVVPALLPSGAARASIGGPYYLPTTGLAKDGVASLEAVQ
jgi:hypothetical protein